MEFRLLGPVEVVADGKPLDLGGRKQKTVLSVLVANAGHPVSNDQILQAVWGEDAPAGAVRSLHTYISNLRNILDSTRSGLIEGSDGSYRLRMTDTSTVDWIEFERLSASDEIDDLRRALEMWRGRPLGDVEDEWALSITSGWEQERIRVVERWADLELESGDLAGLIARLKEYIDEHPFHEPLWARLMIALYRAQRQSDALAAYQSLRTRLAEELGIDPSPDLQDLEERILLQDRGLLAEPTTPTNVPAQLNVTVGRTAEWQTLASLLETTRLLTITGAGGVGKTTAAKDLARSNLTGFPDGVWWFELAQIADPDLIIGEMLGAMRRPPPKSGDPLTEVVGQISRTRSLLVFDNCEHLVERVARIVGSVLAAAANVKVVATSREPLRVPGEVAWSLPPLATPGPEATTAKDVLSSDAAALFDLRARQANPEFTVDDHTARRVAAICRRLDGLPFAIELAAARLRSMGLSELEGRLDDRFRLLTGGSRTEVLHHQTLRGTVEWSYDLLGDDEGALYAALSVFRGGFELDAAEAVSGMEHTFEILDALVAGSLLVAEPVGDRVRYKTLETIREHAAERLAASGREAEVRGAHLSWVADLVRHEARELEGSNAAYWISRFRREMDNMRAALGYAANSDPVTGALICSGLSRYWFIYATERDVTTLDDATSFLEEGRRWSETMLDSAEELPDKVRARLLTALGGLLLIRLGRLDEAAVHLAEARRLWEEIGDTRSLGWAVFYQATATWSTIPVEETIELFDRALTLHETAGDPFGSLVGHLLLGYSHIAANDFQKARTDFETSSAKASELDLPWANAHADDALSMLAVVAAEVDEEEPHRIGSAIKTFRDIPNYACLCHAIQTAGMLFASNGRPRLAARCQGVVYAIRERLGMTMAPYEDRTSLIEQVGLAELDIDVRRREESAGHEMSPTEGVDWVLAELSS